jgi:hypothetical protein
MQTFILRWDGSDTGYAPVKYAADIKTTAAGALAPARWSFGSRRGRANAGNRVFLLRQQVDRGIVASGHLTDGDVFEAPRWNDPSRMARYVRVIWDRVVAVEDRLPIDELLVGVRPSAEQGLRFRSGAQTRNGSGTRSSLGRSRGLSVRWGRMVDPCRLVDRPVHCGDARIGVQKNSGHRGRTVRPRSCDGGRQCLTTTWTGRQRERTMVSITRLVDVLQTVLLQQSSPRCRRRADESVSPLTL